MHGTARYNIKCRPILYPGFVKYRMLIKKVTGVKNWINLKYNKAPNSMLSNLIRLRISSIQNVAQSRRNMPNQMFAFLLSFNGLAISTIPCSTRDPNISISNRLISILSSVLLIIPLKVCIYSKLKLLYKYFFNARKIMLLTFMIELQCFDFIFVQSIFSVYSPTSPNDKPVKSISD